MSADLHDSKKHPDHGKDYSSCGFTSVDFCSDVSRVVPSSPLLLIMD